MFPRNQRCIVQKEQIHSRKILKDLVKTLQEMKIPVVTVKPVLRQDKLKGSAMKKLLLQKCHLKQINKQTKRLTICSCTQMQIFLCSSETKNLLVNNGTITTVKHGGSSIMLCKDWWHHEEGRLCGCLN